MTRDLFPHDRLDDSFYAKAIAPLQDEAAKDAATRKLLSDGIAQLNAATMASAGAPPESRTPMLPTRMFASRRSRKSKAARFSPKCTAAR